MKPTIGTGAWKGTGQRERLIEALLPDNVKIDDRSKSDFMKLALEYGKLIRFHDVNGRDDQSWESFFSTEPLVLFFIIADTDFNAYQRQFLEHYGKAFLSYDPDEKRRATVPLLNILFKLAAQVDYWNENLAFDEHTGNVVNTLRMGIKSDLAPHLRALYAIKDKIDSRSRYERVLKNLGKSLGIALSKKDRVSKTFGQDDLEVVKATFDQLYLLVEKIDVMAKEFLRDHLPKYQDMKPHVALFYGFLSLYEDVQSMLNELTKKHLDFYFEQVLRQSKKSISKDEIYVEIKLSKKLDHSFLNKGEIFLAGKDKAGHNIEFETTADNHLTGAVITDLKSLFVARNPNDYTGLKEKSITGIFSNTLPLQQRRPWKLLGEDQFYKSRSERTMKDGRVGFMVVSDYFNLAEGERDLRVTLKFSKDSYQDFKRMIAEIAQLENRSPSNAFLRIFLTAFDLFIPLGGKEVELPRFSVTDEPDQNGISISIELSADDQELDVLKIRPPGDLPPAESAYLKILLRDESHIYVYPLLDRLKLENIKVECRVKGMRQLQLYNNYGQLSPTAPFQLFGAIPEVRSYLMVGCREAFSKSIKQMQLRITWYQLPEDDGGWTTYFEGYQQDVTNSDYQVSISVLHEGLWYPLHHPPVHSLFTADEAQLSEETLFHPIEPIKMGFLPEPMDKENPYNQSTRRGYLRLELVSPDFAFGHQQYAHRLTEVVTHNSKLNEGQTPMPQPQPPVSPVAKSVSLDYEAGIHAFEENRATGKVGFYHLHPFGYRKVPLQSSLGRHHLLPRFEDEGHLMIGLDRYPTGGDINLFFHLSEGNVHTFTDHIPQPRWQYLASNRWIDFKPDEVRHDSTHGFVHSGLVSLHIPKEINTENTVLESGKYWIKVSFSHSAEVACKAINIHTNAVHCRWVHSDNLERLSQPLPEGSITQLKEKNTDIAGIHQIITSINGKGPETQQHYYRKVSERLRHKNRAITVWDYERLILEAFPIIYRVKCETANARFYTLPETERQYQIAPGHIRLILIPDVTHPRIKNKQRPKVSLSVLVQIEAFLKQICSPFVQIELKNPHYERVRVICKVRFQGNESNGYYTDLLNTELKTLLTPWLGGAKDQEEISSSIYKSKIMAFIEGRPYVRFVTSLSLVKTSAEKEEYRLYDTARTELDENGDSRNPEEIEATYPWSIITTAVQHEITAIQEEKYANPIPRGIDNMKLGLDFIITN